MRTSGRTNEYPRRVSQSSSRPRRRHSHISTPYTSKSATSTPFPTSPSSPVSQVSYATPALYQSIVPYLQQLKSLSLNGGMGCPVKTVFQTAAPTLTHFSTPDSLDNELLKTLLKCAPNLTNLECGCSFYRPLNDHSEEEWAVTRITAVSPSAFTIEDANRLPRNISQRITICAGQWCACTITVQQEQVRVLVCTTAFHAHARLAYSCNMPHVYRRPPSMFVCMFVRVCMPMCAFMYMCLCARAVGSTRGCYEPSPPVAI